MPASTNPVLIGEDEGFDAVHALAWSSSPVSVFADQRGRVVAGKLGELHQDEADPFILDRVQDIDSGAQPCGRPAADRAR